MSILSDMSRAARIAFPGARRQAAGLGLRLREARLRRRMAASVMAERVGVSRDTLHRLEKGDVSISLAVFLRVLQVLGLAEDIDLLAKDDVLGRKLEVMNQRGPRPRRRGGRPADG
jgi:transcriptional regulator with XRE-family HTH domain